MRRTSIPALHAEPITGGGGGPALFQLIRERGGVPAIVVGRRAAQQILSLDAEEVDQATRSDGHAVVRIDVGGEVIWARVVDVVRDPERQVIRHVEMTRLPKGEVVVVDVPVDVLRRSGSRWDDAPLKKLESVRIEGPVETLPDILEVNARRLRPHESITLADLKLPRYCEPIDLPFDTPVVTVLSYGERDRTEKETASGKP